jgi:hypothetical protein
MNTNVGARPKFRGWNSDWKCGLSFPAGALPRAELDVTKCGELVKSDWISVCSFATNPALQNIDSTMLKGQVFPGYCAITICDVLLKFNVLVETNGKIKLKA